MISIIFRHAYQAGKANAGLQYLTVTVAHCREVTSVMKVKATLERVCSPSNS